MKRTTTIMLTAAVLTLGCSQGETPEVDSSQAPAPVTHEGTASVEADASPEEQLRAALSDYSAKSLEGSNYRVGDQKGKVVLINAWATWCGPCRYEIPELKRLHREYGDKGLEIIGVSIDMGPAEPAVRQFVEVNKIEYPILLDPQSRLTTLLRTTSIPTSVMLDRDGNVVWRHIGIVSEQRDSSFREALSRALGS